MNPQAPILLLADPTMAAPLVAAIARQAPELTLLPYSRALDDATLSGIEVGLGWRFAPGVAARLPALRWVYLPARLIYWQSRCLIFGQQISKQRWHRCPNSDLSTPLHR